MGNTTEDAGHTLVWIHKLRHPLRQIYAKLGFITEIKKKKKQANEQTNKQQKRKKETGRSLRKISISHCSVTVVIQAKNTAEKQ